MKTFTIVLACVAVLLLLRVDAARSDDREKDFEAIGKMKTAELAPKAKAALEKKYPNENWEKYHFPKFVYLKDEVTLGYKIAVKEPELLAKFPCYCGCVEAGHKNLSYCYLKGGKLSKGFDSHGAGCNTCNGQSMMAFLWNELGVDLPKMQGAMKEISERE